MISRSEGFILSPVRHAGNAGIQVRCQFSSKTAWIPPE
jgi:hypothetical protein